MIAVWNVPLSNSDRKHPHIIFIILTLITHTLMGAKS